jgi:hypothetical protein
VESRVLEAAALADTVVVPLAYQSTADLMPAVKTVSLIEGHSLRIAFLINNTEPAYMPELKGVLAARFPDVPILVVNRSRYISRLADDGLTLADLADLGALNRFHLRHILPQMQALHDRIDAGSDIS